MLVHVCLYMCECACICGTFWHIYVREYLICLWVIVYSTIRYQTKTRGKQIHRPTHTHRHTDTYRRILRNRDPQMCLCSQAWIYWNKIDFTNIKSNAANITQNIVKSIIRLTKINCKRLNRSSK